MRPTAKKGVRNLLCGAPFGPTGKRFLTPFFALLFVGPLCMGGGASAVEPPAADAVRVSGSIKATQGSHLNPREATLTTTDGKTYHLLLDEKGRSLTKVMHGQSAEVWAVPSSRDGRDWLTVLGYTDERVTAAHELWRHMRCSACVVTPATANAAAPGNLHGAVPVEGRYWAMREPFTAWTRDERFLWLASDLRVMQIDLAAQKLVSSYGRPEGLPDEPIYGLASDGRRLWIVHRGGVATLPIGVKGAAVSPWLASKFARVFVGGDTVWVISISGTFRFKAGEDPAARPVADAAPALPTADQISRTVEDGIWIPHWHRRTAHFIAEAVTADGKLLVSSYGDIYEFDGTGWKKITSDSWALESAGDRVWFLSTEGLNEYSPATGRRTVHEPPEDCRGQYVRLVAGDHAAWVVAHPGRVAGNATPVGGGLCRLDLKTGEWQSWTNINDHRADRICCLAVDREKAWAVSADGRYESRGAHPGMTYVKHTPFVTTGFHLHDFDGRTWTSVPLKPETLDRRLICGQDGCRDTDDITPHTVDEISVGTKRIFGTTRLVPRKYFGGYWPSLVQVASRPGKDAPWAAAFRHAPDELNLQGEQPLVLNISYGMILQELQDRTAGVLEAVGHDHVLGLFLDRDTHWALTEGCAGRWDEAQGSWLKVVEGDARFYWRATAALEDHGHLYIGSDRGLITRLDLTTGRFTFQTALDDREITRIARNGNGQIVATSRPAELGILPVGLLGRIRTVSCPAVKFDGRTWSEAGPDDLPTEQPTTRWHFKQLDKRVNRDKSQGNFLFSTSGTKPLVYVKEVFYPQVLCEGEGGRSLWLSTYTGLVRIPFGEALEAGK